MKVLLKFTIEDRECGILKNSENEANRYINDLTRTLKDERLLTSMKREGSGAYRYSLIAEDMLVTKQPVGESTKYRLTTYVDNVRQTEYYMSSNFDALKTRVHKALDSLNYNSEQIEDIRGQWSMTDEDNNIRFNIDIVDNSGHTTSYFDPLGAVKINPSRSIAPVFRHSRKYNLKARLLIKYPDLRTTARVNSGRNNGDRKKSQEIKSLAHGLLKVVQWLACYVVLVVVGLVVAVVLGGFTIAIVNGIEAQSEKTERRMRYEYELSH